MGMGHFFESYLKDKFLLKGTIITNANLITNQTEYW